MTEAEKIRQTCDLLGLTPAKLAKAMGITGITMYRWLDCTNKPKGMSAMVLAGLHQSATTLAKREDGERLAKLAGSKVSLGIGALIFYGLKDLRGS